MSNTRQFHTTKCYYMMLEHRFNTANWKRKKGEKIKILTNATDLSCEILMVENDSFFM